MHSVVTKNAENGHSLGPAESEKPVNRSPAAGTSDDKSAVQVNDCASDSEPIGMETGDTE